MTQYHFILDMETIGQDVFKCPMVNCSYLTFDWNRFTSDNPYTFQELLDEMQFAKFDIQSQMESGCSYKKDDIDWWTSKEKAKHQLKPTTEDITIAAFTSKLEHYLKDTRVFRWWSRSNTFDPILLHRAFMDFSSRELLDSLLPFWLIRDIRTYIDTQFQFKNKVNGFCPLDDVEEWKRIFVEHDSRHDVCADILRLQKIERAIHCS